MGKERERESLRERERESLRERERERETRRRRKCDQACQCGGLSLAG